MNSSLKCCFMVFINNLIYASTYFELQCSFVYAVRSGVKLSLISTYLSKIVSECFNDSVPENGMSANLCAIKFAFF